MSKNINNIQTTNLSDGKVIPLDAVVIPPTHTGLVKIAERWLYKTCGCGVVFTEFVTAAQEIPDAFGLRSDYTILVECKTSRADFLADREKFLGQMPESGIGDYRFYLCTEGLIKPVELPGKWGLLYWTGKKVKKIVAPWGNIWNGDLRIEKSQKQEYRILYSALRRIKLSGDLYKIYEAV